MSTLLKIVESALTEHEMHYHTRTVESGGIVSLTMGGASISIAVDEESAVVRILGSMTLELPDEAKLQQAYQMVNEWNMENITKYYLDSDGDLTVEWYIDADDGMFSPAIFNAGFGRVAVALREAKAPMMKLCYC